MWAGKGPLYRLGALIIPGSLYAAAKKWYKNSTPKMFWRRKMKRQKALREYIAGSMVEWTIPQIAKAIRCRKKTKSLEEGPCTKRP
mmetsp:Transcript_17140/g.12248  ORF Transcript_17140/g.12248 Transcript_17140/m.12248 type:complete len:86 (-) Transcript_17140:75-332(-)